MSKRAADSHSMLCTFADGNPCTCPKVMAHAPHHNNHRRTTASSDSDPQPQPAVTPKLPKLGPSEGSGMASSSSTGGAVGGLLRAQAQELSLWGEQLMKTDWGGLVRALPPMPTMGAHSPLNQNVLKAFEFTPPAKVRCVLVAKVRSTAPCGAVGKACGSTRILSMTLTRSLLVP